LDLTALKQITLLGPFTPADIDSRMALFGLSPQDQGREARREKSQLAVPPTNGPVLLLVHSNGLIAADIVRPVWFLPKLFGKSWQGSITVFSKYVFF
jgi:hypothetical protein